MLLNIWQKPRTVRRFSSSESANGYEFTSHEDLTLLADVQTSQRHQKTEDDGDSLFQTLKVFSNDEFQTADEATGRRADLLWFQGKWFECRSSILSDNTILSHWTSEFVQCLDQQEPPEK